MVKSGPDSAFRARLISRRAHFVPDLVNANLLTVRHVATQDNVADVLTKGLGATTHRKARLLLCMTEQQQ
eukprot:10663873-Prorocentrum_lima.AAC.1